MTSIKPAMDVPPFKRSLSSVQKMQMLSPDYAARLGNHPRPVLFGHRRTLMNIFGDKNYELAAIVRVQAWVRGYQTRKQLRLMYANSHHMPLWLYKIIVAIMMVFKLYIIVILLMMLTNVLTENPTVPLDQRFWATPFQGNRHEFGANYTAIVWLHITTALGLMSLVLWPVLSHKGHYIHRVTGRMFVGMWMLHLTDGLINAGHLLLKRGFVEANYIDPSFPLYLFLQFGFLATQVADFVISGLGNLQFKVTAPRSWRVFYIIVPIPSILMGLVLMGWGVYMLATPTSSATGRTFGIIYCVEFPAYIVLSIFQLYHWTQVHLGTRWSAWMLEHGRCMLFTAIIAVLTFFANVCNKYWRESVPYVWGFIEFGFGGFVIVYMTRMRRWFLTHPATRATPHALEKTNRAYNAVAPALAELEAAETTPPMQAKIAIVPLTAGAEKVKGEIKETPAITFEQPTAVEPAMSVEEARRRTVISRRRSQRYSVHTVGTVLRAAQSMSKPSHVRVYPTAPRKGVTTRNFNSKRVGEPAGKVAGPAPWQKK